MPTIDEASVFWVDDVVRIQPNACRYNNTELKNSLKGDNFNWIVTKVDAPNDKLYLGAYQAFNQIYGWYPPIEIKFSDAEMIDPTCRHSDTVIDPAIAPTCTTSGKTEGKRCVCEGCKKVLIPPQNIDPLGHDWEIDLVNDKRVCKRCKVEETIPATLIDVTSTDIKSLIKIIEGMLEYDPTTVIPPDNEDTSTEEVPADPVFDSSITFDSSWNTDYDLPYLLYSPSSLDENVKTPLIVWLHGSEEVGVSEEIFRSRGLPAVMSSWSLHGFNSYILCPRIPDGTWMNHEDAFFGLLNHVVTTYNIETRKIAIVGHSLGGTGTEYMAYQRPKYFSCQVIMSGYDGANINLDAMKDMPTRIYAENETYSSHYNTLRGVFGDSACTVLNCSHGEVPDKALTSEQTSGVSDLFFWMLSQTNTSNYVPVPENWFDDALFIGNSLVEGLQIDSARLGEAQYFAVRSVTVDRIFDQWASDKTFQSSNLKTLLESRVYGKIFLYFGTNECGWAADTYCDKYTELVDTIRSLQPDAKIIIHAAMTVGKDQLYDCVTPQKINELNNALSPLLQREYVQYMDFNSRIAEEDGYLSTAWSNDGLHLTFDGYKMWANWIWYNVGYIDDSGEIPESVELQVPFDTIVTVNNTPLRTGPGSTYAIADETNKAHAGQQITIVQVVEAENYTWGKLDPNIWKKSSSRPSVSNSERWIPLENTTALNKTEFVPPEWIYPISYDRVASRYGMRTHPIYGDRRKHNGIDLSANWGTPVYATRAGTVAHASYENGGAGNFVRLTHDDQYASDYFHLEERFVSEGDTVEAGQMIGRCGSTGLSTGPHLHFQIVDNGSRQNPENYIDF